MTNSDGPRNAGHIAFGVAIMAIGVMFLLDRLALLRPDQLTTYWPVLFVAFGLSRIVWPSRPGGEVGGMWIALIGGLLLLDRLNIAALEESWPVFVILAGLTVVFRAVGWLPSDRPSRAGGWNEAHR